MISPDTTSKIDTFKELINIVGKSDRKVFDCKRYMNFVVDKYPSRVLYGLHVLRFSSYCELSKLLDLKNRTYIYTLINDFIQEGLVTLVRKDTEDYKIISRFWPKIYPTSSQTPIFFKLNKEWDDAIGTLEKSILRNNTSAPFLGAIKRRAEQWKNHYKIIKAQLDIAKKRKKQSKGTCMHCDRLIMKDWTGGKEYHTFPAGYVCALCVKRRPDLIPKWRSAKA